MSRLKNSIKIYVKICIKQQQHVSVLRVQHCQGAQNNAHPDDGVTVEEKHVGDVLMQILM